jgi:DNA-binding NtrC family response regulator
LNVLFLSSTAPDRDDVVHLLTESGHQPVVVETAEEAGAHAESGIDMVLIDLAAGAEALHFLRTRQQRSSPAVVAIADRRRPDASTESLRLGVADMIARPVRAEDLVAALANGGEFTRLSGRALPLTEVTELGEGVFGASPAMREVLAVVRRVAHSRCRVLIVGERGTGREMIARAIHARSPGHSDAFLKLSCAEITSQALDAALDAQESSAAMIYLEDVEELKPELQTQMVMRLSDAPAQSRVIAGARPRIFDWVERGLVRRTLVQAIAVVRLDLPPLRQRAQDLPLLATHFLKEACRNAGLPLKTFSRGALALLAALPWPGNATELRALCERLAVLVPRGVVLLEDVTASVRFDGAEAIGRARGSLKDARDLFEREFVTAVLQRHKGRMGAAAQEMGIERTNLYRKIKQLKIDWSLPD